VKNGDKEELARSRQVKLELTCGLLVACQILMSKRHEEENKYGLNE